VDPYNIREILKKHLMQMAQTSDQKKTAALMDTWASSRIAVFAQASIMMLIGMGLFAGAGYLLDNSLGTFPGFFIGGLVLAFPLTQFAIYKKVKSFSQDKVNNQDS